MANDQAIGMMDGAYFVGRKEILDWVNETLDLNVLKIEDTCTGAVACQLVDVHFPGRIALSKVNWEARSEYEYINNYKILQSAFNRLKIERAVDVEKLVRGKYQDNLEFMQWFKGFCDRHEPSPDYNPVERRAKGKGASKVGTRGSGGASASADGRASKPRAARTVRASGSKTNVLPPPPDGRQASEKENRATPAVRSARDDTERQAAAAKMRTLEERNGELQATMDGLEKERDFYYDKLREIEILLMTKQEELDQAAAETPDAAPDTTPDTTEAASAAKQSKQQIISDLLAILYATTDEFVAVDGNGNPIDDQVAAAPDAHAPVVDVQ